MPTKEQLAKFPVRYRIKVIFTPVSFEVNDMNYYRHSLPVEYSAQIDTEKKTWKVKMTHISTILSAIYAVSMGLSWILLIICACIWI